MKALDSMILTEISDSRLKELNGGVILIPWKQIIKGVDWALRFSGVYDACQEFKSGYNACRT